MDTATLKKLITTDYILKFDISSLVGSPQQMADDLGISLEESQKSQTEWFTNLKNQKSWKRYEKRKIDAEEARDMFDSCEFSDVLDKNEFENSDKFVSRMFVFAPGEDSEIGFDMDMVVYTDKTDSKVVAWAIHTD